ncbi:MAG: hypothetical protein RML32_12050, partial [Gammaproteobacteria bacterium]|nr:hypothetical protein [Gammaproteobacteria bacterium]
MPKRSSRLCNRGRSLPATAHRSRPPPVVLPREVEGVVSAHRDGYGFVRIDGSEATVFLPPPAMTGLVSGDRVRVAVRREADGRYSGRVL